MSGTQAERSARHAERMRSQGETYINRVRLPADLRDRISSDAKARKMSVSSLIALILRTYYEVVNHEG